MTDELQQLLIDLEAERNYAARQTGLLIQARNEIKALEAINTERAKEIDELKAALLGAQNDGAAWYKLAEKYHQRAVELCAEVDRLTECVKALETESLPDEVEQ